MASSSTPARPFLPNLVAGTLCAIVTVAFAGSFGGLVFNGALAPFVPRAVLAVIISSIIVTPFIARLGSFFFAIGGPESNPTVIVAFSVAALTAEMLPPGGAVPVQLLPTVLAAILFSATACGLALYLMGWRRWGRYVRYIPHPVVGGFLAGNGYLLVVGAWKTLTGHPFSLTRLGDIAAVPPLAWATVVVVACLLVVLTRLTKHFLVIPVILIGAMLFFHGALIFSGLDVPAARAAGLLLAPLQPGDWTHAANFPYAEVRWDLLADHVKDLAAMIMVVVISLVLNCTSLEVGTGVEGDADRDLKAVGLANICIGLCGGLVAVNSFNRSVLSLKAGANSWLAGLCYSAVLLAVVLFSPGLIGLLPRPVLTGLLLFLGFNLVYTWLIENRRKMPWTDNLIVLAIVGIVAWLGIVPGVILGTIISCVGFVFTLSRGPSIRTLFSLASRHSNVERPATQRELLRVHGETLRGFSLQGYLFFGTVSDVIDVVRADLRATRFVLLDFRLVHGIDGSATVTLRKLKTLCSEVRIVLVFTEVSPAIESMLHHAGVGIDGKTLRLFPDIDRGLEWCEDQIIASNSSHAELSAALAGTFTPAEVGYLVAHFERIEIAAGSFLLQQDDPSEAMFLIEEGRVSVYLTFDHGGHADHRVRLRSYTAGTVVGEMGLYTGEVRSADVVADEPTRALKFSVAQLAELERREPALAHKLHRFVVCGLAHRLAAANAKLRALT